MIVIVDDSPFSRVHLQELLVSSGYTNLMPLSSAQEAFAFLKTNHHIDLILMDIVMPGIDGLEACRAIKQSARSRDIPIIMVTASGKAEQIEKAFSAGAVDYITKPINRIELGARVRAALRLKGEIDRRKARERQLEALNEKLQRLSSLDGLTEIANRRHFDETLYKAWLKASQYRQPLSLLLLDIDYFKRYNDTYGHLQGDACLKQVAKTLAQSLQHPTDLAARYGGEEFVVLLPATDLAAATKVGERIRSTVADLSLDHSASPILPYVTVSVGVATANPFTLKALGTPQALISLADRALYKAKEAGRNSVAVCHATNA